MHFIQNNGLRLTSLTSIEDRTGPDYITLQDHLLQIKKKRSQSIILFTSPQKALKKHSLWHPVFKELFSWKLFSLLLVINEAYCVKRQGHSFRPEFKDGLQEFSNIANSFVDIYQSWQCQLLSMQMIN
jgi:superfamily II DNA helicase RecQ